MVRDSEGFDYCDGCGAFLGYAYPTYWCPTCTDKRVKEDTTLMEAAAIIHSRNLWDYGGGGQARLETVLADRFDLRKQGRKT